MSADLLIGTQGWNYPAWVGPFYPMGTRREDMLECYARAFRTVEVDSTFYAVPPEPIVEGWRRRVGDGFVFSLKVPQEITHERRLRDVEEPLDRFLGRLRLLGDRIGVLLVQLSPDFAPTPTHREALAAFVDELPAGRWAVEFRDPHWVRPAVLDRLRERNVALALADGRWIRRDVVFDTMGDPTADFAYVRWMGPDRRIRDYARVQVDRDAEMAMWSSALGGLRQRVRTVFGYFNNHWQGHSPQSARDFQRLSGQRPVEPAALRTQAELF